MLGLFIGSEEAETFLCFTGTGLELKILLQNKSWAGSREGELRSMSLGGRQCKFTPLDLVLLRSCHSFTEAQTTVSLG